MSKIGYIIRYMLVIYLLIGILSASCKLNTHNESKNFIEGEPAIKFDTTFVDFGTIIEGEKVAFTFKFKNIGTGSLIIQDAYSSCGCAVPNYSKDPVAPGEIGKIEVVFDSEGKHGMQYKTVTLKLNTKIVEKSIYIKANVV